MHIKILKMWKGPKPRKGVGQMHTLIFASCYGGKKHKTTIKSGYIWYNTNMDLMGRNVGHYLIEMPLSTFRCQSQKILFLQLDAGMVGLES